MATIRIKNIITRRDYLVNYQVVNDEGVDIREKVFTCHANDDTECMEKFKTFINENDPLAALETNSMWLSRDLNL